MKTPATTPPTIGPTAVGGGSVGRWWEGGGREEEGRRVRAGRGVLSEGDWASASFGREREGESGARKEERTHGRGRMSCWARWSEEREEGREASASRAKPKTDEARGRASRRPPARAPNQQHQPARQRRPRGTRDKDAPGAGRRAGLDRAPHRDDVCALLEGELEPVGRERRCARGGCRRGRQGVVVVGGEPAGPPLEEGWGGVLHGGRGGEGEEERDKVLGESEG